MIKKIKRHYAYLNKKNEAEFSKAVGLVYQKDKEKFNENYKVLEEFFSSDEKYEKSLNYLKSIYEYKEKWATAHRPVIFTAGAHTTSRAEAVNSLIKRYINKSSELSGLTELVEEFDKSYVFEDPILYTEYTKKKKKRITKRMTIQ